MSVMTANRPSPRPGFTHVADVAITQIEVSDFAEIVDMCRTLRASLLVMDARCLGEPTGSAELVESTVQTVP